MMLNRSLWVIVLTAGILLPLQHLVFAAPEAAVTAAKSDALPKQSMAAKDETMLKSEEKETETKELSGEVSAVGPSGIAVLYSKAKKSGSPIEIFLPFRGKIRFTGYKRYKDIREGDRVKLIYEETVDKGRRMLTEVVLLERAPEEEEEMIFEQVPAAESNAGAKEGERE